MNSNTDMFKCTHIKAQHHVICCNIYKVQHHVPINSPVDIAQNMLTNHKLLSMQINVKMIGNSVCTH